MNDIGPRPASLFVLLTVLCLGLMGQTTWAAPSPSYLLVVNKGGNSVSYINLNRMRVTDRVSVGPNPHEIALTPDGTTAVVSNYDHGQGSTLSLIDVSARNEMDTVSLDPLTGPHGIVLSPNGNRAFVTCEGSKKVAEVDLQVRGVTHTYKTKQRGSHMIAFHPERHTIYTANIKSGSATVIDVRKNKESQIIRTAAGAEGISLGPNGNEVWVTNRNADSISVIDTTSNEVVDTIQCPGFPIRITHDPTRPRAFVTCFKTGELVILNTNTRSISKRLAIGSRPVGIQVMPEDNRVFVANTGDNSVMLIDTKNGTVLETIPVPNTPDGLALVNP